MAKVSLAVLAAGLPLLAASPCMADAIDGTWCNEKTGKTFEIHGPSIVTPGGARLEGAYTRHSFRYTVPEAEAPAGAAVAMRLLSENVVQVQAGETSAPELWRRCEQTS
ncbi:hypothetical protein SLNSH_21310 [Alsobacter soli]|uniref:DUF2147 domain-containing protein n=1 Tax=Alsobacter soli TaxID=2109933 RepID=A0A2T1HMP4_9HYPH|nr:hypothetical protein [Alsobacter soli]PSC02930.1 hypothetical protein SLNSH_21310 [Alsobacter soli]